MRTTKCWIDNLKDASITLWAVVRKDGRVLAYPTRKEAREVLDSLKVWDKQPIFIRKLKAQVVKASV